jgi:hypothetical protein
VTLGRECMVHKKHDEKVPVEPHYVRPRPRGGGDSQALTVCANAHGRIHYLLDSIEGYAVSCPYATPSEVLRYLPAHVASGFNDMEQVIASRGWMSYGLGFLNGRYSNAYRWWATDGSAKEDEVPHYDELFHASRWSRKWRRELNEL